MKKEAGPTIPKTGDIHSWPQALNLKQHQTLIFSINWPLFAIWVVQKCYCRLVSLLMLVIVGWCVCKYNHFWANPYITMNSSTKTNRTSQQHDLSLPSGNNSRPEVSGIMTSISAMRGDLREMEQDSHTQMQIHVMRNPVSSK